MTPTVLTTDQEIKIGTRDQWALRIDKTLTKGESHPCEIFRNPVLASTKQFEIAELEVWTFRRVLSKGHIKDTMGTNINFSPHALQRGIDRRRQNSGTKATLRKLDQSYLH